jgi:serine protease
LYVGTTPGGAQLVNVDRGTSLNATATGLPTNGSTLYVRLWSMVSGSWMYNDYTYTAAH